MEKGLCGCIITKDVKIRLSWIIQVIPKSNDKCPYMRQKRRDTKRGRSCEDRGRDCSEVSMVSEHLEPPEAGRSKKFSPLETSEGVRPYDTLILDS